MGAGEEEEVGADDLEEEGVGQGEVDHDEAVGED